MNSIEAATLKRNENRQTAVCPDDSLVAHRLPTRVALRRLQQDARLTAAAAESYLLEVREERLAAEDRRPA
jgi:hypothetical protein